MVPTRHCPDHELAHVAAGRCPLCVRGVYPSRDLRAIRDFAGLPLPGTTDVPAGVPSIRHSEVARRIGRELASIEAERRARCADLDVRARELRREMRAARVSTRDMLLAVRVAVGLEDEEPRLGRLGRRYLSAIQDDGVDW